MRIYLHIGPEQVGAGRLQSIMADKRAQMADKGVLFPRSPGGKNHTRLFMAVTDPDHVEPLRYNRGYRDPAKQAVLRGEVAEDLAREVAKHSPETLILSASQLGASLHRRSELERLKALLTPLSEDIRIVAHVDEPARLLARHYGAQVFEGRASSLEQELRLAGTGAGTGAGAGDWWQGCLDLAPEIDPAAGQFIETQAPAFWLDFTALVRFWEDVFGTGAVTLRGFDPDAFAGAGAIRELQQAFGFDFQIGKVTDQPAPTQPSAAWLTRARQLNALILHVLADGKRVLPRQLWRSFLGEIEIDGDPLAPGALAPVAARFAAPGKALLKAYPGLESAVFRRDRARKTWTEADPEKGYRASQYLLAFMYRIERATRAARKSAPAPAKPEAAPAPARAPVNGPGPEARALMTPRALENYEELKTSRFAPHNRLGRVNEEELAAAFTPAPPRRLAVGSSGNVIVACMKNEAPYIVEWIAYHRTIGVDHFLIYANDCTDGTAEILTRLDEMGVIQYRNNDVWKGNSPQQHALNLSLNEPLVRAAEWIIHIDVDEFINVRTGNGTLQDFLALVPDATNVAMTWRMFGNNGVRRLDDRFVIDQFDACAPKYCPKPHTVWGFKTMVKNIGAYAKFSCHRPNKLDEDYRDVVKWVNGSGHDMTHEVADNGWRNSRKSIGYDLLQLNHYALRSADGFLVKRQRGRALHVDRSIGLNYWIRMDWSDFRDITIKRNLPRLRAEYDRLMGDDTLRDWHDKGLNWHRSKAEELHGTAEFEELYQQAMKVKLTETERVAYALALDTDS